MEAKRRLFGRYLLCRHAVGLAQRCTQQRLEVEVETHGRLAVKVRRAADTRHLHEQVLESRPRVEVPRRPVETAVRVSLGYPPQARGSEAARPYL